MAKRNKGKKDYLSSDNLTKGDKSMSKEKAKRMPVMVKIAERIKNTAVYVDGEIPEIMEGNIGVGRTVKRILLELRREVKTLQGLVTDKVKNLRELREEEQEEKEKGKKGKKGKKDKKKKKKEAPPKKKKKKKKDEDEDEKPKKNKSKIDKDLRWLAKEYEIDISEAKSDKKAVSLLREEFNDWDEKDWEFNKEEVKGHTKFCRIIEKYELEPEAEEEEEEKPKKPTKKKKGEKKTKTKTKAKSKKKKEPEPDDDEDFEEDEDEEDEEVDPDELEDEEQDDKDEENEDDEEDDDGDDF